MIQYSVTLDAFKERLVKHGNGLVYSVLGIVTRVWPYETLSKPLSSLLLLAKY